MLSLDGHTTTWSAADAQLGWWGPYGAIRPVVAAATDAATLPENVTWYLVTNLPSPGAPRERHSRYPAAALIEVVRIYGLWHWAEQSYKHGRTSSAGPTSRSANRPPLVLPGLYVASGSDCIWNEHEEGRGHSGRVWDRTGIRLNGCGGVAGQTGPVSVR